MTRTRTAATTLAALLALAACGSSDSNGDQEDTPSSGATEATLRQAVQDNLEALNDGDAAAVYDATSTRCRRQTSENEISETADLIDTLYGDIELETLDIVEFNGDNAIVRGTTGIDALDEPDDPNDRGARWVFEEGTWRSDDC